jgi:hypothetical protein
MYQEISLNQLCTFLKKKKPTIHGHLKTLIEIGLVAEPIFKSVEADNLKGASKKNVQAFYSLAENYNDILNNIDPDPEIIKDMSTKMIQNQIATAKTISNINIMNLYRANEFFSKIENSIEQEGDVSPQISSLLQSMVGVETDESGIERVYSEFSNSFYYFTEKQFHKYRIAYNKFMRNFLNEIYKDEEETKVAKTNYVLSISLPMKKIIEFLNK